MGETTAASNRNLPAFRRMPTCLSI
jgi:hypothetical protein